MISSRSLARRTAVALLALSAASCPGSGGRDAVTFSRSFGGVGWDEAAAAIPATDGGFLFAGTAEAYHAGREPADAYQIDGDVWLTRLDGSGNLDWQRTYGVRRLSPAGNRVVHGLVQPAPGGGTWVGGGESMAESPSGDALADGGNVIVTRLDPSGAELWTRAYDSGAFGSYAFSSSLDSTQETLHDMRATPDGGLLLVAWTAAQVDKPSQDRFRVDVNSVWVAKLDGDGDLAWDLHLFSYEDGVEHDRFFPYVRGADARLLVRATDEGGALVSAGSSHHTDSKVVRVQSNGTVLWSRTIVDVHVLDATGIDADGDGVRDDGFVLAGRDRPLRSRDGFLARLDAAGNGVWIRTDDEVDGFGAIALGLYIDPSVGLLLPGIGALGTRADRSQGLDRVGRFQIVGLDGSDGVLLDPYIANHAPALRFDLDAWELLGITDEDAFVSRFRTDLVSAGFRFLERVPDPDTVQMLADGSVLDIQRLSSGIGLEMVLTRQDPTGAIALEHAFPLHGGFVDRALSLVETHPVDGGGGPGPGVAVLGETSSFGSDLVRVAWLLLVDRAGDVVWQRLFENVLPRSHFGGPSPDLLRFTQDGGLVFGGWVDGHLRLIKVGAGGQELWNTEPLSPEARNDPESCDTLIETADGGFAVAGRDSIGRGWVARLDANGTVVWRRVYARSDFSDLAPTAVAEIGDGLVVAGTHERSAWVMRLGADGTVVSSCAYPWERTEQGEACQIAPQSDGGILLATTHIERGEPVGGVEDGSASTGRHNVLLLRLDPNGGPMWYRVYGALYDEVLADARAVPEGGFLVSGRSESLGDRGEAWLLRTDYEGLITESCNAYLEGGAWQGTVRELPVEVADYAPDVPPGMIAPAVLLVAQTDEHPSTAQAVAAARQCAGFGPVGEPDDGDGGGGNGDSFTLTLVFDGGGEGLVESSPAGISCRDTCSATFPAGTRVELTPFVDEGFVFSHWEGCDEDSGSAGCAVVMDEDRTVEVYFE